MINDCEYKIILAGIGGAGIRVINRMIDEPACGVEFIGMDTDENDLGLCKAPKLLHLGKGETIVKSTPAAGEHAAIKSAEEIFEALDGADMLIILCGMGGDTGTGAACAVAEMAKKMGIFTLAIATSPFYFEGNIRLVNAMNGIDRIKADVDGLAVISNDKALEIADWNATIWEALKKVDDALLQMVQSVVEMLNVPGEIKIDIEDLQWAMKDKGTAYIGIGKGSGYNKVKDAVSGAVRSQWQEVRIHGANRAVFHITGDINLSDLTEAADFVRAEVGEGVEMLCSTRLTTEADSCVVTVVTTGPEEPLDVLLRGRQRACNMRCWFIDSHNAGWVRGVFTQIFCGACPQMASNKSIGIKS